MIHLDELKNKIFKMVNSAIDNSNDIKVIDKAVSLIARVNELDTNKLKEPSVKDKQRDELQAKMYNKVLEIIDKASKELTIDAMNDVGESINTLKRTINL